MNAVAALALSLVLVLNISPSFGADKHDHAKMGANGGQVVDAGPYHLELVVNGQELTLYVLDEKNSKVSVDGAKASAIVMSGGGKTTIAPAGDNALKGARKFQAKEDMRVLLSLTLPGKATQQARFTPLHKEGGDHKGHGH
ncbi:MAG: hypothetical protein GEV05_20620 [Betaproteobacteria bacterium]|nr:hypothetical protein [Betaproteobacteria bacterium]